MSQKAFLIGLDPFDTFVGFEYRTYIDYFTFSEYSLDVFILNNNNIFTIILL